MAQKQITNAEVKNLIQCLDEFNKRGSNFPAKVWYALSRNYDKLISADKHTEKARIKLVEKYAVTSDDSEVKTVPEEKMADFQKEYIDLLNDEVTVEFYPLKMSTIIESGTQGMNGVNGMYLFFQYIVEEESNMQTV